MSKVFTTEQEKDDLDGVRMNAGMDDLSIEITRGGIKFCEPMDMSDPDYTNKMYINGLETRDGKVRNDSYVPIQVCGVQVATLSIGELELYLDLLRQ